MEVDIGADACSLTEVVLEAETGAFLVYSLHVWSGILAQMLLWLLCVLENGVWELVEPPAKEGSRISKALPRLAAC